ncbi:hypothetical protein PybrP1_010680 [[Pythium] brassicae (nom. inval.)]|nr:hypothetical protein PybrP1_010680 [[Pythium] brassicae (nom. inval.)]
MATHDNAHPRAARRRQSALCRHPLFLIALLVVSVYGALVTPAAAATAAPVAFEALTWPQWRELHDAAATARTLERVYRRSPRVRAKLRVATQLSMDQFLAGDAIFRQQLSDVVGTSAARVQLEFLQTSALRAGDPGEFVAAFGISALPDPSSALSASNDTIDSRRDDSTAALRFAIDLERARIVQRLRYGGLTARGLNATVSGLTLFGVAATLVDVVLDGEVFYPVDMTPWVAARLAVVPSALGSSSDSPTTADTFASQYSPATDAYQSLRLRFLLAKTLRPLRIETSDIILRESAPPFGAYYSDAATVIEAEVHAHDEHVRAAVGGYLRNASLAREFAALEPQWRIAAIDVDARSGVLYSPLSAPTPPAASSFNASALEVALALQNVSFAHVDSHKWRILERFARVLEAGGCSECQVSYSRVAPALATADAATSHNDGDADTTLPLDPLNARSVALVVSIAAAHGSLATSVFTELAALVATGASSALCERVGVVALGETVAAAVSPSLSSALSTCAVTTYENLSSEAGAQAYGEPFVLLNVTLGLTDTALAAFVSPYDVAASAFEQYRVRCALLVLVQQVAVFDDDVQLVASAVLADQDEVSVLSLAPPIRLSYRVAIRDESQRRGIAQHFLSTRFKLTVADYTLDVLDVRARAVDLHADGSPSADDRLPGFAVPRVNVSAALALSNQSSNASSTAAQSNVRVYRYDDPMPVSDSASTLWNPSVRTFPDPSTAPQCSEAGASTSSLCLSIQFSSAYESGTVVFLRQITANAELSSPSLVLPSPWNATTPAPPAPWIEDGASALIPSWVFHANLSGALSSSAEFNRSVVLRFHFEFMSSLSAPESLRHQASFLIDVRVDPAAALAGAGSRKLVVRKDSFQPLVAGGNASVVFSNPFVAARLAPQESSQSTPLHVAFTIERSSVGGFFPRGALSQCTACSSLLTECDAAVECKALAACVGAYANSNPALYASMLRASPSAVDENATISLDTSWTLGLCVHGEQRWNSSTLALFLGGLHCVSSNRCAVAAMEATSAAPKRAVVLRYSPMEQTLTFAGANFTATLEIRVDSTDADGIVTSKSETFANLTQDDASLSTLSKTLMGLYGYGGGSRGYRDEDMLTSFVRVSRDRSSSGELLLRIRYFSLALWGPPSAWSTAGLPVLRVLSGDAPLVSTQAAERLELLVVENV